MSATQAWPATACRVEAHTPPEVNERIRLQTYASVARLQDADPVEIDARLAELEREWDVERALNANAGTIILASVALGHFVDRRFLLLTTAVLRFFAQHAIQGWCPPIPVLRRRGFRTMREIERERFAIKALRGDFEQVPPAEVAPAERRVRAALAAVDA